MAFLFSFFFRNNSHIHCQHLGDYIHKYRYIKCGLFSNISDIPYKCQGLGWKPNKFSKFFVFLDDNIHFQFYDGTELIRQNKHYLNFFFSLLFYLFNFASSDYKLKCKFRNFFLLLGDWRFNCTVHCKACTRDQGKDT